MMHPLAHAPLLALLLITNPALAHQPTDGAQDAPQNERGENDKVEDEIIQAAPGSGVSFSAHGGGTFLNDTDFDGTIGTFQYNAFNAGIKGVFDVGEHGHLSLGFDSGWINYDITPSTSSVAGDAASIGAEFDDVTTLALNITYSDQTNEGSSWYITGGVLSGAENDADFNDSIDGLFGGGFRYKLSDTLELGLGVLVKTRLDDDVLIVPIPQIRYTIDERWSIASEGAGIKLNYKASEALNYGLSGQYRSTTFRLDAAHAFAPNGMATQRAIPVAFYARYAPSEHIELIGKVGGVFGGELEILNTGGNTIASQGIDTALFGSIAISFKF